MKETDFPDFQAGAQLEKLREAMKGLEAPARVEAALLEAFRDARNRAEGSLRRKWWKWAAWGVAGMILLAAGIGGWMLRERPLDPPPLVARAPQAPPEALVAVKRKPPERVRTGMGQRPQKRTATTGSPAAKVEEVATGFIAVTHPATWPEEEIRELLRVRLPRSAAAVLGVPVNAERADEMLQADVVVGQDGVVRAVRFVQ